MVEGEGKEVDEEVVDKDKGDGEEGDGEEGDGERVGVMISGPSFFARFGW